MPVGDVRPGGAGAQHPQDAVQHLARVPPRATATVGAAMRLGDQRLENLPLVVLEIHGSLLDTVRGAVGSSLTHQHVCEIPSSWACELWTRHIALGFVAIAASRLVSGGSDVTRRHGKRCEERWP